MTGNNVRVGAGAVVRQDVLDNSIVVSHLPPVVHAPEPLTNRHFARDAEGEWCYLCEG